MDEKKEGGDESNPLRGRVEMDSYLDSGDFYSHEDETKKLRIFFISIRKLLYLFNLFSSELNNPTDYI